ncbi:hypothetical protein CTheo_7454 [Ceratobasidium theobromae]|uniref:Transmembrane protein n=1 Tax=Ceratobasidium theobromae TaxID=1582974 RepID=A0A5N5QCD5_9AGAM|nr:hypothetical protein CTheo_7454 [Ceratobasidium theobromae]
MPSPDDFERDSGRATRARTRLIVEGFSNLALIAIFFAGVQAQLISVTNDKNENALAVATNAAFFGGLIFCVFTAVLATLSARWFSILREDDSDYLSSRWLAQDRFAVCAEEGRSKGPDLKLYLDYQISSLEDARNKLPRPAQINSESGSGPGKLNPTEFDIECILKLLKNERGDQLPTATRIGKKRERASSQQGTQVDDRSAELDEAEESKTAATGRERILSYALFSPLIVAFPSFSLFILGIILLTWNKLPRPVAIFTSATALVVALTVPGATKLNEQSGSVGLDLEVLEFASMNGQRLIIDTTTGQGQVHAEPTQHSAPVHTPTPGLHGHSPYRRRRADRQSTSMSISQSMMISSGDYGDGISGRATRQRTQLIVDGFSNLALVAVLFSGVQAQLISITVDDESNMLAVATNAVFFGGLMLSVFSALLASLSGRWFSILREDDSEYLSSCWLATECNEKHPNLEDYVRFQLRVWEEKMSDNADLDEKPPVSSENPEDGPLVNPRDEDIRRVLQILEREKKEPNGDTTVRERLMSKVLLSALMICTAAFVLFCCGIIMLVWNKQRKPVAIFTSAIVLVCGSLIPLFFLKHRRKHVISQFNLGRPAL